MTRINLVNPDQLTDKHLMAEYRELPRIFTYVKEYGIPEEIPETYVLGEGHMKFFCDKLWWLIRRYKEIHLELIFRGFSLDVDLYRSVLRGTKNLPRYKERDYTPTPAEIYLNMKRLAERHFKTNEDQ